MMIVKDINDKNLIICIVKITCILSQGSKGLSLFYLEVRDANGNMNNIQMLKLKNKLGTRQLPTAELLIDGAKAFLASFSKFFTSPFFSSFPSFFSSVSSSSFSFQNGA
jgi:hypothetical protein